MDDAEGIQPETGEETETDRDEEAEAGHLEQPPAEPVEVDLEARD